MLDCKLRPFCTLR